MKKIGDREWEISGLIWWTARLLGMPALASLERHRFQNDYVREITRAETAGRLKRSQKNGRWVWSWSKELELRMTGEIDPLESWNEEWDGCWRLFSFDLPAVKSKTRMRLLRTLKRIGYGKLQDSLWISPRCHPELNRLLEMIEISPSELSVFKATNISGRTDDEVVDAAWKWDLIETAYEDYQSHLKQVEATLPDTLTLEGATEIIRNDAEHWLNATEFDPFLPKPLEGEGYSGKIVWAQREALMRKVLKRHQMPTRL